MMADFRALCAELLDWAEVTAAHYIQLPAVMLRARAALADEPAVPEGREPTRDELWELWLRLNNELPDRPAAVAEFWEHAQINARARWGKPTPVPPADGEVGELVRTLTGIAHWRRRGRPGEGDPSPFDIRQADRLDRAAELLERLASPACVVLKPSPELIEAFKDALPGRIEPLLEECHPTPVPVAERLPGPVSVSDALIKAECALSDIAEGEPMTDEGDPLQWAERRCADTLAIIRPTMRQHKIRTSEWPPLPLPEAE